MITLTLPCLSVRQPWVWAILHAGKDVENRSWPTRYRGPCLLHAAKGCDRLEHFEGCEAIAKARRRAGMPPGAVVPALDALDRGGIVGAFELWDVYQPGAIRSPWHVGDYGFRLRNVVPLELRPLRGNLGLFPVELTQAEVEKLSASGLLRSA